jgi:A/G-specific adenine glycosylase
MRRQRKLSIDPALRDDFGRRLRSWYRRNARDLPWRRTRSPHEVLVSELMLQQTQVSRVITKYGEFLGQFPTLGDVARSVGPANRGVGLGYYARAATYIAWRSK